MSLFYSTSDSRDFDKFNNPNTLIIKNVTGTCHGVADGGSGGGPVDTSNLVSKLDPNEQEMLGPLKLPNVILTEYDHSGLLDLDLNSALRTLDNKTINQSTTNKITEFDNTVKADTGDFDLLTSASGSTIDMTGGDIAINGTSVTIKGTDVIDQFNTMDTAILAIDSEVTTLQTQMTGVSDQALLNATNIDSLNVKTTDVSYATGTTTVAGNLTVNGAITGGNIKMIGNVITSTDTNGDITINPNGDHSSGGKVKIANAVEIYDERYNQQFFKIYPAFFPFGPSPGSQGAMGISATGYNDATVYPFILWEGLNGGSFSAGRSRFYSKDTEVFNLSTTRMQILQDLLVSSTTASANTTTGALRVSGGVGVAGNINCGGNLNVTGTATINGLTACGGKFSTHYMTILIDKTSETTMIALGTGNLIFPANTLVTGDTYKVNFSGSLQGSPTLTIRLKLGTVVIGTTALAISSSNVGFQGEFQFSINENGHVTCYGNVTVGNDTTYIHHTDSNIITANSQTLDLTAQWSSTGNRITTNNCNVYKVF